MIPVWLSVLTRYKRIEDLVTIHIYTKGCHATTIQCSVPCHESDEDRRIMYHFTNIQMVYPMGLFVNTLRYTLWPYAITTTCHASPHHDPWPYVHHMTSSCIINLMVCSWHHASFILFDAATCSCSMHHGMTWCVWERCCPPRGAAPLHYNSWNLIHESRGYSTYPPVVM